MSNDDSQAQAQRQAELEQKYPSIKAFFALGDDYVEVQQPLSQKLIDLTHSSVERRPRRETPELRQKPPQLPEHAR